MTIWRRFAAFAEVETSRLLLRPFTYKDAPAFHQMISEEGLPYIFPPCEKEVDSQELLVNSFMRQPLGVWAIVDKESQVLIGAIRFENLDEQAAKAELGYFLSRSYWNKGLMTEAVQTIVYLGFYQFGLRELVLLTHLENQASQRVAEKVGFHLMKRYKGSDRYSHKMREYLAFSMTARDFRFEGERDKK